MSWICEIAVTGDTHLRPALHEWLSQVATERWISLPHLQIADFYEPTEEESRDPFNHEVAGPLLIAMLDFDSAEALRAAMSSARLLDALQSLPPGLAATSSAFERRFYAVEGSDADPVLAAPISYVVRYHRPAENEALFIENYVESHPPTQAKLPGIRSIMCYFPRPDLSSPEWPHLDYLVGNEVVFDSVDHFNAAMESPVRQELRAHFREFPPFSGANTHFLMQRKRLRP
ncbi:MAG: hypothetical protein K0S56_20 [Microvirga sp.]|jgi:hypothetical protein|nr:hypothetical protein [Microvirga sp.]